ncbi:MAG: Gfo/Idh/MocA family oxidoreductase [Gammaproteobacteria bacterium]
MNFKVAIVGPGRSKQGTGPFIAQAFKQLGCNVQAVASSSLASATKAAKLLKTKYSIECKPYDNLEELLKNQSIDVVAISSPVDSHFQHLTTAINAGCHVFCEKPLCWPSTEIIVESDIRRITNKATELVELCNAKKVLLQLNTQWPYTLPAYYKLYPQLKIQQTIESFSMWLSPQSLGSTMIIDAVPHLLSMLYSLLGSGKINNIESNYNDINKSGNLQIELDYLHAYGDTRASISLISSDTFPKPAAYAINGLRVDRHVELPDYLISLHSAERQLPVEDPLVSSIKNYISTIYSKSSSDEVALIDGMTHLTQIFQAVTQQ